MTPVFYWFAPLSNLEIFEMDSHSHLCYHGPNYFYRVFHRSSIGQTCQADFFIERAIIKFERLATRGPGRFLFWGIRLLESDPDFHFLPVREGPTVIVAGHPGKEPGILSVCHSVNFVRLSLSAAPPDPTGSLLLARVSRSANTIPTFQILLSTELEKCFRPNWPLSYSSHPRRTRWFLVLFVKFFKSWNF